MQQQIFKSKLFCLTLVALNYLMLTGCQTPQRHNNGPILDSKSKSAINSPIVVEPKKEGLSVEEIKTVSPTDNVDTSADADIETSPVQVDARPKVVPKIPKVGVILGPGGMKTYAHIGVLQEFQKNKIPISKIAGIEWGALAALFYAWRGSVNDIEWQMFKIKNDEFLKRDNLISSRKEGDYSLIAQLLKSSFHNLKAEDLNKEFSCPAHNVEKNKVFLMNRGSIEALIPFCLSYPPIFKIYQNNLAAVRDVQIVAEQFKKQGINYIVYINVLGGNLSKAPIFDANSTETMVWSEIASDIKRQNKNVDFMMTLNLDQYSLLDLNNRRSIMQSGAEQSSKAVKDLAGRLGL